MNLFTCSLGQLLSANRNSQKIRTREHTGFNVLTKKCPELKIQNDTSSYHDCIGLHFPGVEVGIINYNGGYAIPHCFSCCNTMLYNSEQHATIRRLSVIHICHVSYRISSLHTTSLPPISEPSNFLFLLEAKEFLFLHSDGEWEGRRQDWRLSSLHTIYSFCSNYKSVCTRGFPRSLERNSSPLFWFHS